MAGKKYRAAVETIEADKVYPVAEAVKMVKTNATSKFDETIEIAVRLGVDPKYADQMVRGVVSLPSGTGKDVRVAVFARDAKAEEAREAGAEVVVEHRRGAALEDVGEALPALELAGQVFTDPQRLLVLGIVGEDVLHRLEGDLVLPHLAGEQSRSLHEVAMLGRSTVLELGEAQQGGRHLGGTAGLAVELGELLEVLGAVLLGLVGHFQANDRAIDRRELLEVDPAEIGVQTGSEAERRRLGRR